MKKSKIFEIFLRLFLTPIALTYVSYRHEDLFSFKSLIINFIIYFIINLIFDRTIIEWSIKKNKMNKSYKIYLKDKLIGTSNLEKADAPMGVVMGKINFLNDTYNYAFLKKYCTENSIEILNDDVEYKCIITSSISDLKVVNEQGKEIVGKGNSIEGMDSDFYEISIFGIAYPFYKEEFYHHVKEYETR